uniref:Uncharacterized protein n=1 Tax=Steinernema glaseri TaxID=37863 RepID=A0A1I7ZUC6_9BILA
MRVSLSRAPNTASARDRLEDGRQCANVGRGWEVSDLGHPQALSEEYTAGFGSTKRRNKKRLSRACDRCVGKNKLPNCVTSIESVVFAAVRNASERLGCGKSLATDLTLLAASPSRDESIDGQEQLFLSGLLVGHARVRGN